MNTDQRRELRALLLGRRADRVFKFECARRGLDLDHAILAPLDSIIGTPHEKTPPPGLAHRMRK
jgi:hypothetical protein